MKKFMGIYDKSDLTYEGTCRKYEGFCKESSAKHYSFSKRINTILMSSSTICLLLKFAFKRFSYISGRNVLLISVPMFVISFVFLHVIIFLKRKKPEHWVALQNMMYATMLEVPYFGLWILLLSSTEGRTPSPFIWISGIVVFVGGLAMVPIFSVISALLFYTLSGVGLYFFNIKLSDGMWEYMAILMAITIWVLLVRFSHEYKEYENSVKLNVITEEATKLKAEAEAANATKSKFLAHMSHEIRTPINSILGNNEMILRESHDKGLTEYATNIDSSGKMLLTLVNDILDISKIEAGKLDIVETEYSLSDMINELDSVIEQRAEAKSLKLLIQTDESIPNWLYGDEIRVKQIITNLLTNAVKYTDEGSVTVRFSCEKVAYKRINLLVSVTDTGIGIRSEDLEKLNERFVRLDEVRNKDIEGSGLGISITNALLHLMDGTMTVESEYGKGSVFSVVIPQQVKNEEPIGTVLATRKIENEKKAPKAAYKPLFISKDITALIVDDNAVNRNLAKALLKSTGVNVILAESGEKMLSLIKDNHYDIIFLDHMMPNMDGIEALSLMKKNPGCCAGVPVIVLTANAITGVDAMYREKGFTDYLSKPINSRLYEEMFIKYIDRSKFESVDE